MSASKHLLLWSSLAALALLVFAAVDENLLEDWRRVQRGYLARTPAAAEAGFAVQLRQIVVPGLDATDRCVSCHVGMAPGESALAGDRVTGKHPDVVHDPTEYGCTVCHSGQGRATEMAAAHGDVAHWPEPMIPQRYAYAGCGSCHTHLYVPELAQLKRGRALVERNDCLACHRLDGRGGTLRPGGTGGMEGPDLSRIGPRLAATDWYSGHLEAREAETAPASPWRTSFTEIAKEDRQAIDVLLASSVGAPGLVEAKATFHSLGCRGCHKVGGVGGDDGPDLTHEGALDPGQLDFSHVPGEKTIAGWHEAHFRAPGRVVPGSQMPYLGLTSGQIDRLTFYMMSLRRSDFPGTYWPKDRVRAERFGDREFALDGATLYGTFCAACHGPEGEGMRYPGMTAFPAIANEDFLRVASDAFIEETVSRGRPGRRMPAWGRAEGGLRPEEIDAVVAHVRTLGGGVAAEPDPRPARWAGEGAELGAPLYASSCASCHGAGGKGGEGPALNNQVLLKSATDTYLAETILRGRRGTSMEGFARSSPTRRSLTRDEAAWIVAYIRQWEKGS